MSASGLLKNRVVDALRERGRTQEWLAQELGITPQAVSQGIASGNMKLANATRIAELLEVSLDWLVGLETRPSQLGQVVNGLPDEQKQLSLDFLLYQIDRADEKLLSSEQAARYTAMIEKIQRDIARRRNKG